MGHQRYNPWRMGHQWWVPGREIWRVGEKETYDVGNFQGCVETSREVLFVYVGIHGRGCLVPF
jgi:hypothetical protein